MVASPRPNFQHGVNEVLWYHYKIFDSLERGGRETDTTDVRRRSYIPCYVRGRIPIPLHRSLEPSNLPRVWGALDKGCRGLAILRQRSHQRAAPCSLETLPSALAHAAHRLLSRTQAGPGFSLISSISCCWAPANSRVASPRSRLRWTVSSVFAIACPLNRTVTQDGRITFAR